MTINSVRENVSPQPNVPSGFSADDIQRATEVKYLVQDIEQHVVEAAALRKQISAPTDRPVLDEPVKKLQLERLAGIEKVLAGKKENLEMQILLLLAKAAQEARERGITLRDLFNNAMIDAQQDQVSKMRAASLALIGVAIVSGLSAAVTLGVGVGGVAKNVKDISLERMLNGANRGNPSAVTAAEAKSVGRVIDNRNTKIQTFNSVNQSVAQTGTSLSNMGQQLLNADAKEFEVLAARVQNERQKSEDRLNNDASLVKAALDIYQSLTKNQADARRAAVG